MNYLSRIKNRLLNKNDIPFDQLIMGKPIGDYWIDDRAIKFESWENLIKKYFS